MKRIKTIMTSSLSALIMAFMATTPVHAAGNGMDTGAMQSWIRGYLDPLETVLLWAIPTILGIYLLIKAITFFSKESEGEQQKPYWASVKTGLIVGVVAESVTVLLKIFGING